MSEFEQFDVTAAVEKINELTAIVSDGPIGRARAWGGAGVVIRLSPLPPLGPEDFFPQPRVVITTYVAELSWLFTELWLGFKPTMNSMTKVEFFGRLGNAAVDYLRRRGIDGSLVDLLQAVQAKATAIAEEIRTGRFVALPVGPGRSIVVDLVGALSGPTRRAR